MPRLSKRKQQSRDAWGVKLDTERGKIPRLEPPVEPPVTARCGHSKMWSRASKTKFSGLKRLSFVAQSAILDHNYGYRKACLLPALNINTKALRRSLTTEDEERKRHHEVQMKPKRKQKEKASAEYEPGGF